MEIKVSVIVPVYNVELYLEKCLDSIIKQTFKEMEIILVNDGSTDRSGEIMELFASKDARISVFSQPNQGVSATRNIGIEKAKGKYILFVDSDDTILSNTIEVLYNKATETCADIVMGNALFCYPDGRLSVDFSRNETLNNGLLRSGEEAYRDLMERNVFPPLIWLYFIQRDMVINNQLYFQAGIVHEDELWCVKAILSAKKVLLIDFNYYLYRLREGSIMRSDNKDFRIISLFEVAKALFQFTKELQEKGISQEAIAHIYVRIFLLYHEINSLDFQKGTSVFSGHDYFADLLKNIYPALTYSQQKYCLSSFCNARCAR